MTCYTTHVESVEQAQGEIYYRYARIKASIDRKLKPFMIRVWRRKVNKEALAAWSALAKCNLMRWKVVVPALLLSAIYHIHKEKTPNATPDTLSDNPELLRNSSWNHWLGKHENHDISNIDYEEDEWWVDMQVGSVSRLSPISLSGPTEQRRHPRSDSPDEIPETPAVKKRKMQQADGDEGAEVHRSPINTPPLRRSERIESIPAGQNTIDISDSSDSSHHSNYSDSSSNELNRPRRPTRGNVVKPGERLGIYKPACRECVTRGGQCEVKLGPNAYAGSCISCRNRKARCSAFGAECKIILSDSDGGHMLRVSRSCIQGPPVAASKHRRNAFFMASMMSSHNRDSATVPRRVENLSSLNSSRPSQNNTRISLESLFSTRTTSRTQSHVQDKANAPTHVEDTGSTTPATSPRLHDNAMSPKRIGNTSLTTAGTSSHLRDMNAAKSVEGPTTTGRTDTSHTEPAVSSVLAASISTFSTQGSNPAGDRTNTGRAEPAGILPWLVTSVPAASNQGPYTASGRGHAEPAAPSVPSAPAPTGTSPNPGPSTAGGRTNTGRAEPPDASSVSAASTPATQDATASGRTNTFGGHAELGAPGVSSVSKGKEKEKAPENASGCPPLVSSSLVTSSSPPSTALVPGPAVSTEDLVQKISKLVADEISRLRTTVQEAADRNTAAMDKMNKRVTVLQEEFRIGQLELEERIRAEFVRGCQATSGASLGAAAPAATSTSNGTDTEVIAQLRSEVREIRALLDQTRVENANLADANQYLRQRIVQGHH